jgi:hypothetical protein
MSYNPIVPVAVLAVFGCLIYLGGRGNLPNKGTQVPLVPTENTWIGTRSHDDKPESDFDIQSPDGDHFGLSIYAGGVPYQERVQAESGKSGDKPGWSYKWTVHRYPIDYDTDLGAWAGFRVASTDGNKPEGETGLDIGLRYSPIRLGYGVVSPDILISPRQAGLGISVYPPAQTVRYPFNKLGLGLGYLADYDGGTGWSPYLSLSTRF